MTVTMNVDVLWGPKTGAELSECRDVTVIDREVRDRGGRDESRAAVCDGATVGFDAGRWALMVAEAIVDAPTTAWTAPGFASLVEDLTAAWDATPPDFPTLFHEEAWRRGAATTVAAFAMEPRDRDAYLRTLAIGDAMIVLLRESDDVRIWPDLRAADFGVTPDLLATDGLDGDVIFGRTRLDPGDHVLVMSDAIAHWALEAMAEGRPALRTLAHLDPADFAELITSLRSSGELVDDDVTVLRAAIRLESQPAPERTLRRAARERV